MGITVQSLKHAGLPESAILAAAGSVRQGCAVQFGVSTQGGALVAGFEAWAGMHVTLACEWLCERWQRQGVADPVTLPDLLDALALGREWAGALLVVVDAADALIKKLNAR